MVNNALNSGRRCERSGKILGRDGYLVTQQLHITRKGRNLALQAPSEVGLALFLVLLFSFARPFRRRLPRHLEAGCCAVMSLFLSL